MESRLAIVRNEDLLDDTPWRNLESTMLSERSQAQKGTRYMPSFLGKSIKTENGFVVDGGRG